MSLYDIGRTPAGDALVQFLRVSHNPDGTIDGLAGGATLAQVLADGHDANGITITNAGTPSAPQDLATKGYTDAFATRFRGELVWQVPGNLETQAGVSQTPIPVAAAIADVTIRAATAPTGSSIVVDVNLNGASIFTTQAHRPQIAAGANASSPAVPDVSTVAVGDYLTVDIDQVGSTIPGSDLSIALRFA